MIVRYHDDAVYERCGADLGKYQSELEADNTFKDALLTLCNVVCHLEKSHAVPCSHLTHGIGEKKGLTTSKLRSGAMRLTCLS